jgi:hypothetical protein
MIIATAVAVIAGLAVVTAGVPGRIAAYAVLMLCPGVSLYLLAQRRPRALEAITAAVVLSPVLTGAAAAIMMASGVSPEAAGRWMVVLFGMAGVAASMKRRGADGGGVGPAGLTRAQWAVLGGCIFATLFLTGILPLTSEWWRFRSDAWFHRAVIAEIAHVGLPPDDPYFAGVTLQYMWLYHVVVLVLSRITSLDPFWVMPLLNLQSLAGVYLATMLFAGVFVDKFGHRISSCITVVFGLNGLFWLFLPVKAFRAFSGDVRGMEELARTYSLTPFDMYTTRKFVEIYFSQDFFLDKFTVATAFGLAFALMGMFWWASAGYMKSRRPIQLLVAGTCMVGMLGFHTLFGGVMLVAAFGGMGLSLLFRKRIDGYRLRPSLELAAVLVAAFAVSSPYLYAITHLKQGGGGLPLALSARNIAGILISCAAVIVLAAFQRAFFKGRHPAERYVQFAMLATVAFNAVLSLPDSNTYDKNPMFIYFPLAVIGGWTLADWVSAPATVARRLGVAAAAALLLIVPVNAICLAGYFNTPTKEMYSTAEIDLARWVREHTARDAVFVDRDLKVFLLVAGPRRYLCGWLLYARQWGYNKAEMSERFHVRDILLGEKPLDLTTARYLSEAPWNLYVIDRAGPNSGAVVSRHPELFHLVYAGDEIAVYRVDRDACARTAKRFREEGREEIPQQRMIDNSGL